MKRPAGPHARSVASRRAALLALAALAAGGPLATAARAGAAPLPSASADPTYATNGTVNALVRSGNTLYLGGQFSLVGPRTGPLVSVDASSGSHSATFPAVNTGGQIYAIAPDGSGGEYVGGRFDSIGGDAVSNAAHIRADGTVDTGWVPDPDSTVRAIAVSGSTVYLGGDFATIGGSATRHYAAAVDASGSPTAWDPEPSASVRALAVSGTTIYLGGDFTAINGATARNGAAAVDGTLGNDTGWNPDVSGGTVQALAVSGNTVYLGGDFTTINGATARANAAAVDATLGNDTGWNPSPDGAVSSLSVYSSTVYLGGSFTHVENAAGTGTVNRNHAAAVDSSSGYDTGWDANLSGTVRAVYATASGVYLGGSFSGPASVGASATRNYAAEVDPATGAPLAWNPDPDGAVYAIAGNGSSVLVGGDFNLVDGQTRNNAAAIDTDTGVVTSWNPAPNDVVRALAVGGTTVYLGGDFSQVDGSVTRNYAAAVDGSTGAATAWNPAPDQTVHALAVSGSTVYLGGEFSTVNGSAGRPHLAAVDATTGIANAWDPAPDDYVYAIVVSGSTVYLGGNFTQVDGSSHWAAAAVDATSGAATSFNPNLNGVVYAIALGNGVVYLGGTFTHVENASGAGTITRNYAAAVDPASGYDTGWDAGANNQVNAIALSGTNVYVGGAFTSVQGSPASGVAEIDAQTGDPAIWAPDATVTHALFAASDGTLYAGGTFPTGYVSLSVAPTNTADPQITGTATVGQQLTCDPGTWAGSLPQTDAYQWLRGGNPLAATSATYTPVSADAGQVLTCQVTATGELSGATGTATSTGVTVAAASTSTTTSSSSTTSTSTSGSGTSVTSTTTSGSGTSVTSTTTSGSGTSVTSTSGSGATSVTSTSATTSRATGTGASATGTGTVTSGAVGGTGPAPDSEFDQLHDPYVNTTTGAITMVERSHDPGTFTAQAVYRNDTLGQVLAHAAQACPAFQEPLRGRCRPVWILFGTASLAVTAGGGDSSFVISPSDAAKAVLRVARRLRLPGLRVAVAVTFQSSEGGAPVTHVEPLTVALHRHAPVAVAWRRLAATLRFAAAHA